MKILLAFLPLSFVGLAQMKVYNRVLVYANFQHNKLLLPQEMYSLPEVTPHLKHNRFEIVENSYKNAYKLSDSLFNYFFALDVVNGWPIFQKEYARNGDTKQDYLKPVKNKVRSIYYLGKIPLNAKYDSYLILYYSFLKGENEYMDVSARHLFLVNVANKSIQSITELASYFSSEEYEVHTYSVLDKNQKFFIREKELSSDVILLKGEHPDERTATFHFDNSGYLHIK